MALRVGFVPFFDSSSPTFLTSQSGWVFPIFSDDGAGLAQPGFRGRAVG